jgi:hypothetical protein
MNQIEKPRSSTARIAIKRELACCLNLVCNSVENGVSVFFAVGAIELATHLGVGFSLGSVIEGPDTTILSLFLELSDSREIESKVLVPV